MKLSYLNEKSWADITREERFFTAILFEELRRDIWPFLKLLNENDINVDLKKPENYEPAYEVCFYRDILFAKGQGVKYSTYPMKRTFDMAIFSEEQIVLIEAKANQPFSSEQMHDFRADKQLVAKICGQSNKNIPAVSLLVLHSSKCSPHDDTLKDIKAFSWLTISEIYPANQRQFERADYIYRDYTIQSQ